ncbi:MAG: SDR family NAD(P)-dependent oxidoreductase [Dehalococcoidia bacterium]
MRLRDRNVWLIGASTGIGAALAPKLAAAGARLALSARSEPQLREVGAGCSGEPPAVLPLDVTEEGAIERAADELRTARGAIDVLIYNAGAWVPVDLEDFDVPAFERQIAVNYTGMVRAIGAVLPEMVARRGGDIVGVGSVSAYGAFPRAEAYGSTKAAVNYLLQALRIDARRYGIGVTTVNPGFVRTPLTEQNDFPMPFLIEPEAAAETIVRGLLADHDEIHFPLRLSLPLKVLTALPRPIYEWAVRRALKR